MTECERIIAQGILPREFFREEVRNDFTVTVERKKLFAVLLDILLKIDEVCKKHGIRYFLYGGTLIGAIRHKGFIPWDDDLDVAMLREDYDEFLKLGGEFQYPYFLQTPQSDKGFFWANIAVRNSNTTEVTPYFAYQPMNHGAFVDVFVLDNMINTSEGRETFAKINRLTIDNSTYMRMSNPNLDDAQKARVSEYRQRMRDPFEVCAEIEELSRKYNDIQTEYVTTPTATGYGFDRKLYHREDFSGIIPVKFEGYEFPAPSGFERVLHTTYGDYMQFPPVSERGLRHNILFSADISYDEYIRRHFGSDS